MGQMKDVAFELSISGRNDGTIETMYISFAKGKVAKTRELQGDALLADFDAKGNLLGLEILAPVTISKLVQQVKPPNKAPFRRFIKQFAPTKLITESKKQPCLST